MHFNIGLCVLYSFSGNNTFWRAYLDFELHAGNWEHWLQRVEEYIYPSESVPEFSSILVPNVDNVRSNFLIDTIAKQHKVLLQDVSVLNSSDM